MLQPEKQLASHDDAALVFRCRHGDRSAWEALVRRYQRLIYTVARRAGLDEHAAADVFQTVFARLLAHLSRIADPGKLQAWIVTTAKREAWLAVRRGKRTMSITSTNDEADESSEFEIADENPLPEHVLEQLQQQEQIRRALERLDARCRELLTMLFNDEPVAYDEVARRLGIPVGSIGPTRSRCLGKVRGLIA